MSRSVTVTGQTVKGKEHDIQFGSVKEFKVTGAEQGLTVLVSGLIGAFEDIVAVELPEGKDVYRTTHDEGEWAGRTYMSAILEPDETATATPIVEGAKFSNRFAKLIIKVAK